MLGDGKAAYLGFVQLREDVDEIRGRLVEHRARWCWARHDGEQWQSGGSAASALRLSGVGEGGGNKSEWRGRRMRLQVENTGSGFRPATARGLGSQSAIDARCHAAVEF